MLYTREAYMFTNLLKPAIKIKTIEEKIGTCCIDKKVEALFKNAFEIHYSKEDRFLDFFHKLQLFTFLTNKKLNHLNFFNKEHSLFFSNFIFFIRNNGFTNKEHINRKTINVTFSIIEQLNMSLNKTIDLTVEPNLSINKINTEKMTYLNGWSYDHPNLRSKVGLDLYKYSVIFGIEESNKITQIINSIQQYRVEIFIFNEFFKYLANNKISIFKSIQRDILQDFMKEHFKKIIDNGKCLNSAKREWNIFVKSLKGYFGLDKDLKLTLTREYKDPNKMNLKLVNGKLVKNKLITYIPLEINDDKALYLIKEKINQDLELIRDWAIFNLKEFDSKKNINQMPTRKEMYSIFILLTMDNASITESFLSTLKDKNSYIKMDNNYYLVGNKARRGGKLAEQKIQLTSLSTNIIEKYLSWVNFFEKTEDSFFIYKGKEGVRYTTELRNQSLYNEGVKQSFKKYLASLELPIDYIEDIVKNSYLSKIRATIAIKIYFETENTTKMSQALGHHTYDARLLSHYLPQSILEFYQQRWIRIFQKGLICEALKNSELLFIASNFKNMEQLDLFLKNHMLKNLPDNLDEIFKNNENNKRFDNVFISINEHNLTALFSLKKAISESNTKNLISEKAFFWHSFSEHLEKEILNNREYNEFRLLLTDAKDKAKSINFNKVIYE